MRLKGFRLNSVIPHGIGGAEAEAIAYIYAVLLHQAGQDHYAISIHQVDHELDEFIAKGPGNKIHINIRYPATLDFNDLSTEQKNQIRLDAIHQSMLRIAREYNEYDVSLLEKIRRTVLEKDFFFEFTIKHFRHPKNKDLLAKLVVKPLMYSFDYFAVLERNGVEISKVAFYSGFTNFFYLTSFFQKGKWRAENYLILTGREGIVETHILFDESKVEYVNLTPYPKPPLFELMKADLSKTERDVYKKYWMHGLPPPSAAVINEMGN